MNEDVRSVPTITTKKRRSGTETRRRTKQVAVRFTEQEFAVVKARAEKWGITIPEAIRWPAVDWERIERPHDLSADCWCGPLIESVPSPASPDTEGGADRG